ncbi:unnamed protein product [Nezara viridula]|uniref:Uncharacterized protein n=1 Tax=Nezara viridula TaxID=85310 RepID=A0A9P0HTM4_NEZVI|nr:unnamed protein product [Nezara viridula]
MPEASLSPLNCSYLVITVNNKSDGHSDHPQVLSHRWHLKINLTQVTNVLVAVTMTLNPNGVGVKAESVKPAGEASSSSKLAKSPQ